MIKFMLIVFIYILILYDNKIYSYVKCDQSSACPDGFQCCKKLNGSYGCCLSTDKCSFDGEYCIRGDNIYIKKESFQLPERKFERQSQSKHIITCDEQRSLLLNKLKKTLTNNYNLNNVRESLIFLIRSSLESFKSCEETQSIVLINKFLDDLINIQLNEEFLNTLEKLFQILGEDSLSKQD